MPTYDYRCDRTQEMFELWQSFADDALTVCTQTHDGESKVCGAPVKKVFSKVGIAFKGEGFYKNDHGGSKSKKASESSESSTSSSSGSSDSSSSSSDSSSSTSSKDSSKTSKDSSTKSSSSD